MSRSLRWLGALAIALATVPGSPARAQYGYPGGYGGYGWGGWGGASTVQGSVARGLGAYAAGAGYYNQQTAIANSINTDTVMRWNQYMYESQVNANRNERARIARRKYGTEKAQDQIYKRLRDNPEPTDIHHGDALNVVLDEVNDPRIYSKTLDSAKVKLGGEMIRDIPFQYAAAAITTSIHQITQSPPPKSLSNPEFEAERQALRTYGRQVRDHLDKGETPDPALVDKALAAVNALEAKVDSTLPRNDRGRVEADKYLKSVHGLLAMTKTPALDLLLAGVEKHPDATLGELLQFMNACNLRFGVADTPRQRKVYDTLYPKLVALRDQIAPARDQAPVATTATGAEAGEFFEKMPYEDLQKKAPAPPAPKLGK